MVAPILTTILAADWRIYDPDAQARPQPQARIPKPSPYNRSRFPPLRQLFRISEEHTSELQSLMRNSYAVFCLKNKTSPAITRQVYLTFSVHREPVCLSLKA